MLDALSKLTSITLEIFKTIEDLQIRVLVSLVENNLDRISRYSKNGANVEEKVRACFTQLRERGGWGPGSRGQGDDRGVSWGYWATRSQSTGRLRYIM